MIYKLNIFTFIMIVAVWTAVAVHAFNRDPSEKLAVIPGIPESVKKLASKDYSGMNAEEKAELTQEIRKDGRKIREVMESKSVPEDVKKQIRENLQSTFRKQMMKRVDEYFSLPESQRDAYLEKMRNEWGGPPGGPRDRSGPGQRDGGRRGERGHGPSLARIKEHIESSTPEERAKMAEFHRQMHAKMEPHQSR